MTKRSSIQVREQEGDLYASHEDFHTIFNEDLKELYQLSFLLTRDPAKAERCLVSGLEDCITGNRVFREWARSWAKRIIVQNAIRELRPRPSQANSPLSGAIFPDVDQLPSGSGGHVEMDALLRLEDFERFVFIMCVLEHYSEHDCALLLDCSAREIREARTRALRELMNSSQMDLSQRRLFAQEEKCETTHSVQSVLTNSHLYSAVGRDHRRPGIPGMLAGQERTGSRRRIPRPTDESALC
jgi:DNA-directed RNA polymerase specialized sigma24 family protein